MEGEEQEGSSDFGSLLRRYRLAVGLSQEALAERARLSLYGVSALERGYRRTPQRETLALLAGALALDDEKRRVFEAAAARPSSPRRRGVASVTVGPWSSAKMATLPLALTSFIGRDVEVEEIAALVRRHRLVTITGAGGVGKTQTAVQVAIALTDTSEFAVRYVGLAATRDFSLVVAAIAGALGVQELPNHSLLETLSAYLKNRTLLLLLDNCEHIVREAGSVTGELLVGCPTLRILATSREALKIPGERAYRLPSLGITDAATLFSDRARAVEVHFELTDANVATVSKICRRLDTIPLAIELAAARVNVLTPETLARRLDDRFAVLTSGDRTALPRQQTMRATIDWSYDLLTAGEQQAFERLSAFSGGCTISAAEAVCASGDLSSTDMLDVLSSLIDKSLVVAELDEAEPRYRLLESFREYARSKLFERGEMSATEERHALACRALIDRFTDAVKSEPEPIWERILLNELDDWRSALRWSLTERNDVTLGQELVGNLVMVWYRSPAEGRRWLAAANELVNEATPPRALAVLQYAMACNAAQFCDYPTQLACGEKALALHRATGDSLGFARALRVTGEALGKLGRFAESNAMLKEALAGARDLGERLFVAIVLHDLAENSAKTGDIGAARRYVAEAITLYEEFESERNVARALMDLGAFEAWAGNFEAALSNAKQAYVMSRASNDTVIMVISLNNVTNGLIRQKFYEQAKQHACEALTLAREHKLTFWAVAALRHLATIATLRLEEALEHNRTLQTSAARVFGFANSYFSARGLTLRGSDREEYERPVIALRDALGKDACASLMAAGAALTDEQAFDEALRL